MEIIKNQNGREKSISFSLAVWRKFINIHIWLLIEHKNRQRVWCFLSTEQLIAHDN